mmetsp:Transcript_45516/g.120773  ORF Transcript_45516/g.120773 Transcript_45516/m.120773 type:complete len:257 (+) Transcript_45516:459-1229(+)
MLTITSTSAVIHSAHTEPATEQRPTTVSSQELSCTLQTAEQLENRWRRRRLSFVPLNIPEAAGVTSLLPLERLSVAGVPPFCALVHPQTGPLSHFVLEEQRLEFRVRRCDLLRRGEVLPHIGPASIQSLDDGGLVERRWDAVRTGRMRVVEFPEPLVHATEDNATIFFSAPDDWPRHTWLARDPQQQLTRRIDSAMDTLNFQRLACCSCVWCKSPKTPPLGKAVARVEGSRLSGESSQRLCKVTVEFLQLRHRGLK